MPNSDPNWTVYVERNGSGDYATPVAASAGLMAELTVFRQVRGTWRFRTETGQLVASVYNTYEDALAAATLYFASILRG